MAATNISADHATTGLLTAEVTRAERISPNFVRVTLGGDALAGWRHLGFDQWFRLALPIAEDTRFDRLSDRFDMRGYLRYLTLPKATRPVIRSLTVREFRPEQRELDIDFVAHGSEGVASPWAASLPVGAPVGLIDQGCGFTAQGAARRVVLAGDESALPAVLGVLRDLPADATGHAVIEVPDLADRQEVTAPEGVRVHWIARATASRPGAEALGVLRELDLADLVAPGPVAPGPARPAADEGVDDTLQAFMVGEQQLATGGRRYLVNELGVPKAQVKFCGYWRKR